jgi:hypothetical protein
VTLKESDQESRSMRRSAAAMSCCRRIDMILALLSPREDGVSSHVVYSRVLCTKKVAMANMHECYERFKMGLILGGTVGASMGIIFGTYTVMR